MKQIGEDVKNRTFKPVYLLYGDDAYLMDSCRKQLISALTGDDTMNLLSVSGRPESIPKLKDFTDTLPFFSEYRVVLLSDTGLFKSSDDQTVEWLSSLPAYSHVIFSETEVDKRSRTYKAVDRLGHAAELNHPKKEQAENWVLAYLKKRGMNIRRDAYDYICQNLPEDMYAMENELSKLCDYRAADKSISLDDVKSLMTVRIENRIFDLTEAVTSRDRKKALALYQDLLALREPPMRILFLMNRALNQICLAKKMTEERVPREKIEAALGVRQFVLNKILNTGRRFPTGIFETLLRTGIDLETRVKRGDISENAACELLILSAEK